MYRPLQLPPQIDIDTEPDDLDLNYLDLDLNTAETIQERVQEKNNRNRVRALKSMNFSVSLIKKQYNALKDTANVTSDSIRVFLYLFAINDTNERRLVKSKMVNIFKPGVRQAFLRDNSGATEGIFGGDSNAFKNLEESKKQNQLMKAVLP